MDKRDNPQPLIPIYTKSGKQVGMLRGNLYVSRRKGSKHIFKMLNAWGIDYEILYDLPKEGVIEIRDTETRTIYRTTVQRFKEGQVMHFKEGTKDHSVQVFLPLKDFDTIKI